MKKTRTLAIIVALVIIFIIGINFYVDLLWYNNLEMGGVFWTRFLSVWGLRVASWLFFLLFLWINLLFTRRQVGKIPDLDLKAREFLFQRGFLKHLAPGRLTYYYFIAATVLSLIFASYTGHYWMEMQYFFNPVAFGMTDPLLGQDLSFYIFQLPFLRFLYGFLML
ncbi:MAG: COG1615 family transporter, partial [Firmicutes bacterium]|nr:COG1615 family transporter [Bacillota bacterium]